MLKFTDKIPQSMNRLFLLDAYALIYRAYYAFIKNPRINSKGINTSAVLGFVNTLEEILNKEKPTHLGVAFDPSGPTFRHEAYADYKAQREETPEGIRVAVPIIKEVIRAYRIPILELPGFEADDVIGTLSAQAVINRYVYSLPADAPGEAIIAGWSTSWYLFAAYALVVAVLFMLVFQYKHENTAKG